LKEANKWQTAKKRVPCSTSGPRYTFLFSTTSSPSSPSLAPFFPFLTAFGAAAGASTFLSASYCKIVSIIG